jgi:hypothetical protein
MVAQDLSAQTPSGERLSRAGGWAPWVLVGWTLVVWGGRIRNIVADDELAGFELVWRLGLAVTLVALALVAGAALVTKRSVLLAVRVLALFTIGVWVVRLLGIATGGHSAAFVAVHAVLATVSVGLSVWALRSLQPHPNLSNV